MHVQPSTEACSDLCIMDSGQVFKQFRLRLRGEGAGRVARFVDVHNCILYKAITITGSLIVFIRSTYFLPHYGLGVDSACNRNEYQGCL